jgi:hypothetical protein
MGETWSDMEPRLDRPCPTKNAPTAAGVAPTANGFLSISSSVLEPEIQTSARPGTTNNSQISTTEKMPKTTVLEDLQCAVVPSPFVGPSLLFT